MNNDNTIHMAEVLVEQVKLGSWISKLVNDACDAKRRRKSRVCRTVI